MLKRVIGEDVELRTLLRDDLGNVLADFGQLEQVIMNLVVNARDAMPAGGSVTIETTNVELTGDFIDDAQQVKPGHYVMMAVTDSGTGMDEATKARIFEPFFTTKEVGRGTGLGLSTVYGIVKQNAGYLWVYSELGRGTTFKIYFPRTDAAGAPSVAASALASTDGTETVLLVEDVGAVRDIVRRVLQRRGYLVLDAGGALEALTLAASFAGPIDLLLTDIVLPGANGRELAEQLKQARPGMRVLFTSGYTDDAVIRLGMLQHGFAFMQKPFGPETVERRVRDTLDAPLSA
ncbi:MAG TPA: ATP-binding protein, partial [Gemmatimonadaceae bacterium]